MGPSPAKQVWGRHLLPVITAKEAHSTFVHKHGPGRLNIPFPFRITSEPDFFPELHLILPSLDLLRSRLLPGPLGQPP